MGLADVRSSFAGPLASHRYTRQATLEVSILSRIVIRAFITIYNSPRDAGLGVAPATKLTSGTLKATKTSYGRRSGRPVMTEAILQLLRIRFNSVGATGRHLNRISPVGQSPHERIIGDTDG